MTDSLAVNVLLYGILYHYSMPCPRGYKADVVNEEDKAHHLNLTLFGCNRVNSRILPLPF